MRYKVHAFNQFEELIDEVNTDSFSVAIGWVRKCKDVYDFTVTTDDFKDYYRVTPLGHIALRYTEVSE
jgi:hypothetical protein